MAIPERIPIAREEGYRTDTIGRSGGGQFLGFVTFTLPLHTPDDPRKHKRYYAVHHRFDDDGNHLGTEAWFAGVAADGEDDVHARARSRLDAMIAALGDVEYGDVAVKLFSVEVDGETFGLVDASDPDEEVELKPNYLVFFEPWDGTYDT